MTDREKAIVMAYTGVTMLSGEKFQIFHEYIEKILGRPVWTHELADELVWNEIKEKSKDDFIEICKRDDGWIPVSERLPDEEMNCLITDSLGKVHQASFYFAIDGREPYFSGCYCVRAWMPLPEAYKKEAENE